jgi:hypothetical protein
MSERDLYRFKTCIFFSTIHTSLHFYWFIMSCCVFFPRISPEILAFSAYFFSFHGIWCILLCSFKFLWFLEYWNIWWLEFFSWDIVHENPILFVCWVDIDISGSFGLQSLLFLILGHPIDSYHNTTFLLGLIGSNISLWYYFWKNLCLNHFRNMSSSSSHHNI